MEMTKLEPTERNVCCCMGRAERGLLLMDDRFRNITAKVSADSINGYSALPLQTIQKGPLVMQYALTLKKAQTIKLSSIVVDI